MKPSRFECPCCHATFSRSEVAATMRAAGKAQGVFWCPWACPKCGEQAGDKLPPVARWPLFEPITVAAVDAHNGLWMVKWRTGRLWRVGPLRRYEWTQEKLERLTECGMPLDDEGQPTVVAS